MSKAIRSSNQTINPKILLVEGLRELIAIHTTPDIPKDTTEAITVMFRDKREDGSLLLTPKGWSILKDQYPHWSIKLEKPMTFGDHTFLIHTSVYPYYLVKNELYTFDPDLGITIKMVSGDFNRLKRLRGG